MLRIKFLENEEMEIRGNDNNLVSALLKTNKKELEMEIAEINFRIDIEVNENDVIKKDNIIKINEDLAKDIFKDQIENYERKKEIEGKSKEEIYNIMLEKAKQTGKKQFLCRYFREGKGKENDIDLVNVYVNDDGTKTKEIIHTH